MQVGCGVDCPGPAKPAGRWECALFMSMKYTAMTVIAHVRTDTSIVSFMIIFCFQLLIIHQVAYTNHSDRNRTMHRTKIVG